MAVYKLNGGEARSIHVLDGDTAANAYDKGGTSVYSVAADYSEYTLTEKWASKSVSNAQGFDIYDGKVFWISKSGNSSAEANCYVWNLSDGSQALDSAYITVYSWHGNNLSFDYPILYASSAYTPSTVYVNTIADDYTATLTKTLSIDDGSRDCDACIDEDDNTILWTLGHTADSSDTTAPFYISKWDLTTLHQKSDGTYSPKLLQKVELQQPISFYFQGCKMHDGLLWFVSGYGQTEAYAYGVNPDTGEYIYTIDCQTTTEPEGIAWAADGDAPGGYAMYVGFPGMRLIKCVFGAAS